MNFTWLAFLFIFVCLFVLFSIFSLFSLLYCFGIHIIDVKIFALFFLISNWPPSFSFPFFLFTFLLFLPSYNIFSSSLFLSFFFLPFSFHYPLLLFWPSLLSFQNLFYVPFIFQYPLYFFILVLALILLLIQTRGYFSINFLRGWRGRDREREQ